MKRIKSALAVALGLLAVAAVLAADPPASRSPKEALQAFQDLVGPWRATGTPEGTQQEKQKGFWTESHAWEWQFKGDDVCLKTAIDKGKYFTAAELRYLPKTEQYQLTVATADKQKLVLEGKPEDKKLTLDRVDEQAKETQRLVFTFLHSNRFLYRYEVKKEGKPNFARLYEVGVTKDDVPFAGAGDNKPECVVSGGLGKIPVTYKGETYYVCCTGCRDAFKDDPEKYIKEYQERKAKDKNNK